MGESREPVEDLLLQIGSELEKIREALQLFLKLQLVQANITLTKLRELEEGETLEVKEDPEMELLVQSQKELTHLEKVYAAAEEHYGRGMVPAGLDLIAEAEELGVREEEEEIEP